MAKLIKNGLHTRLTQDGNRGYETYVVSLHNSLAAVFVRTPDIEIAEDAYNYVESQGNADGYVLPARRVTGYKNLREQLEAGK